MPDSGVTPHATGEGPSHASRREWQSFESRMRCRRVKRCILRAEVALSAGFEGDAAEALAEARRLDAGAPTLDAIRMRLEIQTPSASRPARGFRFAPLAAAALVAFAALSGWSGQPHVTSAPASARAGIAIPEPQLPASGASVVVRTEILRAPMQVAEARALTRPPAASDAPAAASRESNPAPSPVVPAPERRAEPAPIEARDSPVARPAFVPDGIPIVPLRPADSPVALAVAAPAAPPAVEAPPVVHRAATAEKTRPVAGNPVAVSEVARVRSVLAQYERAYSSLDAKAARSVWPTVNEQALARAFNGLESQRLTLGRCGVVVDGETAHASCAGSASWTPKVGTGLYGTPPVELHAAERPRRVANHTRHHRHVVGLRAQGSGLRAQGSGKSFNR